MTTIFLNINQEIYIVNCLAYNRTTNSYNYGTEKLETWEKIAFFVLRSLEALHLSKVSSRTLLKRKFWARTKQLEYFTIHL